MDAVASIAEVNKTTIYRRRPSRAALVAAVVDRMRTPLRIVDARGSSRRLDTTWLTLAVRTVIAGARAGTLVRGRRARSVAATAGFASSTSALPGAVY